MVCTAWLFRYRPRYVTTSMIASHATATGHNIRLEYVGQNMDNLFTPPDLLGSLHTKTDLPWYWQRVFYVISMGYVDKEALLPPPPPYHSEQFCHSHLLWFKIMTDSSDHTTGKSQPKILEAQQGKHWPSERKRKQCHLYTAKTKEREVHVLRLQGGVACQTLL